MIETRIGSKRFTEYRSSLIVSACKIYPKIRFYIHEMNEERLTNARQKASRMPISANANFMPYRHFPRLRAGNLSKEKL